MDIKNLPKIIEQDDEGITVTIYQRTGEPYLAKDGSEATVTVVGTESKKYRTAERHQRKRMIQRARMRGGDITPEETEREQIALAAAAVIDWHGWELNGEPAPCNLENVTEFLKIRHIYDQVNAAISGHADFFASRSAD